ncbi:uncharacterized protein LOC122644914 [Telopea speciosissima]|uniref:uncharacterized protein LOC122644914 n=1 Tax=Telopea speciosissima TaxID=54955 RepID=UPI001CC7775E|nr:uncharacterized protein LOC122644914 [Telopea speciosissima]
MGPEILQVAQEKVLLIQMRMKAAQDRQKNYADAKRKELKFLVGDNAFLKIAPMRGVIRFGKRGKLSPRFIGPFEVLRYVADLSHILSYEPLQLKADLSYEETPIQILDHKQQVLQNRTISYVKGLWNNHGIQEALWEKEGEMQMEYPHLFDDSGKF